MKWFTELFKTPEQRRQRNIELYQKALNEVLEMRKAYFDHHTDPDIAEDEYSLAEATRYVYGSGSDEDKLKFKAAVEAAAVRNYPEPLLENFNLTYEDIVNAR